MLLKQIVLNTILSAKREIVFYFVNSALLILVYNLYMDSVVLFYPIILSCTALLVYLVVKGFALTRFWGRLEQAKSQVMERYGDDVLQTSVFETIFAIHQKYQQKLTRLEAQFDSRNRLFVQFIHGMKSSVSVIELACEKLGRLPDPALADIATENEKLKRGLEQALNLLRLDAFASDYVPERVDLADLVTQIINEHKRDFIYSGVYPKLSGGAFVYTDPKWCGFVLGQLISNAVKYSGSGDNVLFAIESVAEGTELRVTDSGIGIPPEDLPRVFEMFFTGGNGRRRAESTGVGLFMARYITDKLGIALRVDSKVGQGTSVILNFRNLTEM